MVAQDKGESHATWRVSLANAATDCTEAIESFPSSPAFDQSAGAGLASVHGRATAHRVQPLILHKQTNPLVEKGSGSRPLNYVK